MRRRFAPHQLRHAHALELLREGVPLNVIQRQLGHRGVTSIYLQGIDPDEIIDTVHTRRIEITQSDEDDTLRAHSNACWAARCDLPGHIKHSS